MNWIKGQPTENGKYHVIYIMLKPIYGGLVTEHHIATVDKIDAYKKGAYFMTNTTFEIFENKIIAWMPVIEIPSEFYDAE